MPVGCLGNAARAEEAFHKSEPPFETILTSSRLNNTEQFAFMQHTLLMQIFRDHDDDDNRSSPSSSSDSGSLLCPTCVGFSDKCCQMENGIDIFNQFIESNLNCHWDLKLSEAISSLRYQGYICPGILVMIANANHLEVVSDAWHRRLLTPPDCCRISQLGVSNGCLVKPVAQTHTISLSDFLCLVLARLKQNDSIVDMDALVRAVENDWTGVAPFCRTNGVDTLKETIHTNLGALIKQRKIYYTGNKGYFLVGNDANVSRGLELKSWRRSLPKRLSFRNSPGRNTSLAKEQDLTTDKECQTDLQLDRANPSSPPCRPSSTSPKELRPSPNDASPRSVSADTSFNLERSQSLRVSKTSQRNIAKGGSLRFSKKEAAKLLAEDPSRGQISESGGDGSSPAKTFERKNSFLGKIFKGSSGRKRTTNGNQRPIILTFSAQFPPPELSDDHHATYQALKRAAQSVAEPGLDAVGNKISEDLYARPKTGPNGSNAHSPEEGHHPIYSKVSHYRPTKRDAASPVNEDRHSGYGGSPSNNYTYGTISENVYNYPPPPLPYRPANWNSGPNSLQSSSSSTSSPTHFLIHSPSNRSQHSASPNRNTGSPLSVKPVNPHQQLVQNQMHLQLHQQHIQHQLQQKLQLHSRQQQVQKQVPHQGSYQTPPRPPLVRQHSRSPNQNEQTPSWSSPGKKLTSQQETNGVAHGQGQPNNLNDSNALESRTTRPPFEDDLLVIERSNRELELRLSSSKLQNNNHDSSPAGRGNKNRAIRFTLPSNHKNRSAVVVDTIHNNNGIGDIIYEEMDDEKTPKLGRPLSECFPSSDDLALSKNSTPQSFPSISDIPSIAELNGNPQFKSLTAQKLMSGLSFNSVDTLLEVNAAAEARRKLNDSTETIDFGVI